MRCNRTPRAHSRTHDVKPLIKRTNQVPQGALQIKSHKQSSSAVAHCMERSKRNNFWQARRRTHAYAHSRLRRSAAAGHGQLPLWGPSAYTAASNRNEFQSSMESLIQESGPRGQATAQHSWPPRPSPDPTDTTIHALCIQPGRLSESKVSTHACVHARTQASMCRKPCTEPNTAHTQGARRPFLYRPSITTHSTPPANSRSGPPQSLAD